MEMTVVQIGFVAKKIIVFAIEVFLAAYLYVQRWAKKKNPEASAQNNFFSNRGSFCFLRTKTQKQIMMDAINNRQNPKTSTGIRLSLAKLGDVERLNKAKKYSVVCSMLCV